MAEYTPVEAETIRQGILQSFALMSEADPAGFLGRFKEKTVGVAALQDLPKPFLALVDNDTVTPEDYEHPESETVTAYLEAALAVLSRKSPELIPSFQDAIVGGCTAIAEAANGVADSEQAILDEIKTLFTSL